MSNVDRVLMSPQGPLFSELVQGYWRLASWNMTAQERLSFLKEHVELGITTVDNAAIYGNSELLFGEALKLDPSVRDKIEIVSKFGINGISAASGEKHVAHYDSSKQAILTSAENSLKRLQTDYLDSLLVHRPDFLMDADQVAEAFLTLKQSGKVKHFGVSNFTNSQFDLLQSRLDFPLMTNQVEINPVNLAVLEDGTVDQLQQYRIRPMAWSCLAGGRVFFENTEKMVRLRATLTSLMSEIGAQSIEQVVFAWVLKHPSNPVALVGSGKIARVKEAIAALSLTMTTEQWYRIWVASKGVVVP